MVKDIIELHRYKVHSNVNYTGMEIDLIGEHQDRSNEVLYVECKAKEKVSSTELRNFAFNVSHKKADFGYFMRTKELEHQAAGLLDEMKMDSRYSNLTFFEPDKIIEMLKGGGRLKEIEGISEKITKKILAVSYLGDFFIYLVKASLGSLPTSFYCIDGKSKIDVRNSKIIDLLKKEIPDLEKLSQLIFNKKDDASVPQKAVIESNLIETVSEVQESVDWFEYLPASSKNFVGRENLRSEIFEFYSNVLEKSIRKRVFYLTGKSGWGKSSLVADIRGRCRNKHYRNRYYTVAIDTRSATSNNFVALSFEKLIGKAIKDKFIDDHGINFTSSNDLLSSDSIKNLLKRLDDNNRVLILIFDQFEDVFRKKGLFKSFYKFLSDVTDHQGNLIIGFSWKTEILIPSDNDAYHYWQQAKEQAISYTIPEFGAKEVRGIIKQLELSTHKLSQEFKRRIIESSQGLPWLTKKLCIHIYHQLNKGVQEEKLISDNLNIEELFKADIEEVTKEELIGLRYIAKKAVEGNFFDITELGDKIEEPIIESLRDKRMIIKSGSNYNIYWDIFRDYLVTNEVPTIGESYLLRQGVNLCFEVYKFFEPKKVFSIQELIKLHPKNLKKKTLENILTELRKLKMIYKVEKEEKYYLNDELQINSKVNFISWMKSKFENYTPYLQIQRIDKKRIDSDDIGIMLKQIFKGNDFQDKTWGTYSKTLIGWFLFTQVDLNVELIEPQRGRGKTLQRIEIDDILPRNSVIEMTKALGLLKSKEPLSSFMWRDLLIFGIVDRNRKVTELGNSIITSSDPIDKMLQKVYDLEKMKTINKAFKKNNKIKAKELVNLLGLDFFEGTKESSKIIYASKALSWCRGK